MGGLNTAQDVLVFSDFYGGKIRYNIQEVSIASKDPLVSVYCCQLN